MWRRSWNCNFELQMKSSLTTHLANQQLLHEKLDDIQFYKIFQTLNFYGCWGSISLACLSCIVGWGRRRNPIIADAKCKSILRIRQQEFQSSLQMQRARQSSNIIAMFLQFFFSSWKWFLVSLDLSTSSPNKLYSFLFHYILRFRIGNNRWWWGGGWCRKKKTKGLKHDLHDDDDDDAEEEDEGNGTWSAHLPGNMMTMMTICARRLWIPLSPRRWRWWWSAQEDDGSLSLLMTMLMICSRGRRILNRQDDDDDDDDDLRKKTTDSLLLWRAYCNGVSRQQRRHVLNCRNRCKVCLSLVVCTDSRPDKDLRKNRFSHRSQNRRGSTPPPRLASVCLAFRSC